MKDSMSTNEETIRELTLIMQQEAHYHHTLMDVVDLIETYGWEPVLKDIIALKEKNQWF
jgi:hypothetical protein